jgi:hypothetical protein
VFTDSFQIATAAFPTPVADAPRITSFLQSGGMNHHLSHPIPPGNRPKWRKIAENQALRGSERSGLFQKSFIYVMNPVRLWGWHASKRFRKGASGLNRNGQDMGQHNQ